MGATDFMPLEDWDHLELWVGNAKQAAYFYEHAFGFHLTAYAGPETGVRDRASYVIEQGDGVKDIALTVPDAATAYGEAVQRGAQGVAEPHVVEDELGRVELASIATYGETVHTFVNRSDYGGPYLPDYVAQTGNGRLGVGLQTIDHVVGNVELGQMNHWVEFYERVFGMTNILHFG